MHFCIEKKMKVWSLCLIICLSYPVIVFASSPDKHTCRPDQRDALWEFKSEFHLNGSAASEKIQTWRNNSDCCSWDGITCDSKTGNVIELNLWGSSLEGPLRSSSGLFKLQYLQSLNLSSNNLAGVLPDSIGNLKYLKVLRLSECNLFGKLPSSLGNLTHLTLLELDGNGFTGELPDSIGNLNQLTKLLIASSNLTGNFPHALLNLTEITAINLVSNQLEGTLPSNMSSLSKLEFFNIGSNSFSGFVPSSLFMIPSLIHLNLERNGFNRLLDIGNISSPSKLQTLSLGGNKISGPIPGFISKLVELSSLDLSFWDTLRGAVDFSMFSHLKSLASLDISTLNTRSIVDMSLFSDFESLNLLSLSRNTVKFSSTLNLLSPIGSLAIASCNISEFPKFLQTQTSLFYLDISQNQIKGKVPEWLWKLPGLEYVDFSRNSFTGFDGPPGVIQRNVLYMLDISSNTFHGPFPLLPKSMTFLEASDNQFSGEIPTICELDSLETLVLSNNNFSGSIPGCLEKFNTKLTVLLLRNNSLSGKFPEEYVSLGLVSLDVGSNKLSGELPKSLINCTRLEFLYVEDNMFNGTFPLLPKSVAFLSASYNQFSGEISKTICELVSLDTLVLSNNNFSGSIPRCFENFNTKLTVLHLQNNNLSGNFPEESVSVGLISIDVGHNQLSGELPKSLINCTRLDFLNVEHNMFNDTFPFGLRLLPDLQVLVLRSNEFHGPIYSPGGSLSFPKLRIFDISKNSFSGALPSDYFSGWNAMSSGVYIADYNNIPWGSLRVLKRSSHLIAFPKYNKSMDLTNKGLEMKLVGISFSIYKTVDISGNRFEGEIPKSICLLKKLIVLNMSNNAFMGIIKPCLSNLTNLESIDLSKNRLSGKIPAELGKLTFLAWMNFSYNMLEGPIPQGTQIQSQDSSSFLQNPGLCGAPLQETCSGGGEEDAGKQDQEDEEENDQVLSWTAAAIAYVPGVCCGFVVGHILTSYRHDWFKSIFHYFS